MNELYAVVLSMVSKCLFLRSSVLSEAFLSSSDVAADKILVRQERHQINKLHLAYNHKIASLGLEAKNILSMLHCKVFRLLHHTCFAIVLYSCCSVHKAEWTLRLVTRV